MEKLDRLGWAAGLRFVSHGVRIGIRVNEPGALERVGAHLPPHWKPSASPIVDELCSLLVGGNTRGSGIRRYNLLYWGAGRVARTMDNDEVFHALEELLHVVVSTGARRRVFVRAAAVAWRGKALIICGPSASGKTALVEALVRAGATFYSDRYVVLDARGRVHPYPGPLVFRDGAEEKVRKCSVESLGGRVAKKPLPVGLVLETQYRRGTRFRPRVLSTGQALLALLRETVQARLRPGFALATCRRVAGSALTLRGKRGEAEDTVTPLFDHLCNAGHDGRLLLSSPA